MTMNKNIINIVNYGDRICASLELAGRYVGMAVLTVRNCTQGWRDVTAMATMRRPVVANQPAMATAPSMGSQYLIPWSL